MNYRFKILVLLICFLNVQQLLINSVYAGDAGYWFERGREAYANEYYDKAIEHYTKTIELNPKFALAYYYRGIAYDEQGLGSKAMGDLRKTIAIEPNFSEAYNTIKEVKVLYFTAPTKDEAMKLRQLMLNGKKVKQESMGRFRENELPSGIDSIIFQLQENAVSYPIQMANDSYIVFKRIQSPKNNQIAISRLQNILKNKYNYDATIQNLASGTLLIAVKNKTSGVLNNIITALVELRTEAGLKYVQDMAFKWALLYEEFHTFPIIKIAVIGGNKKYSDGSIIYFWNVYTFPTQGLDQYLSGEITNDEFNDRIQISTTENPYSF